MNIFEQVHEAGYVYNDLKLDNLMLDYSFDPIADGSVNVFRDNSVNIVDFGFASTYIDKLTGQHLDQVDVDVFEGNMVFSSLNQLSFKSTSRRDDLISLFYLLVSLLHGDKLPVFGIDKEEPVAEQF